MRTRFPVSARVLPLLAALAVQPAQAQQMTDPTKPGYIHPAIIHNIHTCGAANCYYDAPSGGSGSRSGGTYSPNPYTRGHIVERRYGSAAVGTVDAPHFNESGYSAEMFTAVSSSREAADREAMDKCTARNNGCIIIARVANSCTHITATSAGGQTREPARFYVSPYVPPQELPDISGYTPQSGAEHLAKEASKAACEADADAPGRNRHSCFADTIDDFLCAWDVVKPLRGYR